MRTEEKKLRALIAEQAAEWHVAQLDGGLTQQQAQEFMCWLRTSPVHVAEYLTVAMLAKDLSEAACTSDESLVDVLRDTDDGIHRFRTGAEERSFCPEAVFSPRAYCEHSRHFARTRRPAWRLRGRWVAAITVLAIACAAVLVNWQWLASTPTSVTLATRHGQVRTLQLSDRTVLQLDSDSAVTVRFDRHNRRVVVDRGQVYFQVARDSGRPFSVRVGRSLIRDIGTAFDVYRQARNTTITVAEGHVQVWYVPRPPADDSNWLGWIGVRRELRGQPIADLGAGEQVQVAGTGQVTSLGKVDVSRAMAWRSGHVAFDNAEIATVAAEFNRYNTLQIRVVDPRVAALKLTGTFDSHDVRSFVTFLRSLPGVDVQEHGQEIVVGAKSRQRRTGK